MELSEQEVHQQLSSSYPSIFRTVLHMWDAESMWWQRLKLQEKVVRPSDSAPDNLANVSKSLLDQSGKWSNWVSRASEHALEHVFAYQNTKREQFKQPVYQVVIHLVNHSSYHRGQLVNMLRQLNHGNIPATDFIVWSRTIKIAPAQ